jgi:hypothetical protein
MTLKLFILEPEIVFQARVNMPSGITWPLDELTYDTVTTGSHSVIDLNMLVVFGSTAGADNLGRSRIRKFPTSSVLYIGRSSQGVYDGEVNFADNSYITVYRFYPVMAKIPFIDPDGVRYMDSDLDFATYGAASPPVSNAGPTYASTIDSVTEVITVNFDAGNSFVTEPGASIANTIWDVRDGTITVGTSTDTTITATFPAGFRYVSLLVTDDNAKLHTSHVPVLAIDPDDDPCLYNFEVTRHTVAVDGQELNLRVHDNIPAATYPDGTLVMLIDGDAEDADDRTNVLFTGFIDTDSADIGATPTGLLRDTELACVDVMGRLKALPGFSQVLEEKASPAAWGEMTGCNMDRFLHALLQWQSTALDLADWTWSETTTSYPFKILSSDGDTLYDQVSRRAASLVPDHLFTCNRRGQMAVTIDPMLLDTGDRTSDSQGTLTPDYYSDLRYTHQRPPRVHWLRANAILASATEVSTAFAIAPGEAPGQGLGAVDDGENLAIDQEGLNAYCGHKYARLNAPQGLFSITLAEGTDLDLEPAALTWLKVTIDSAVAAQRGLTFTEARFLMKQLDIRYNHTPTGLTKTVTITAERETSGLPATTVTVPTAEAVDNGGWTPANPLPDPAFNNGLTPGVQQVAMIGREGYIWTTSNFQSASPTWSRNTTAAVAASLTTGSLLTWVVDPFSPGYRGTPGGAINGWVLGTSKLFRLTDIFGTPAYAEVFSYAETVNGTGGAWGIIAASFGRFQATESDNPWLMSIRNARTGGGQNGGYVVHSEDGGQNFSSEIAVTAFYDSVAVNGTRRIAGIYMSPRTPGLAYVGAYTATANPTTVAIYKTEDWGATWSNAGITSDLGNGLGYCFHVPWHNNAAESLLYYTKLVRSGGAHTWSQRRTDGATDTDISPTDAGITFGAFRGLFGLRTLDTNRLHVVMVGEGDGIDDIDVDQAGTDGVVCVFVSSDGGDTWTKRMGPVAGGTTNAWPAQAAFASGDSDEIFLWGRALIQHSLDNGANWSDKLPGSNPPAGEIMGIAGGPLS